MSISLAPAALERARTYIAQTPGALGLRFGAKKRGCSGWSHTLDLATEQRADDAVREVDGVRLFIDAASLPLIDGTVIDYIKEGLGEQFVFKNPNVTGGCGCGESFTVEASSAD